MFLWLNTTKTIGIYSTAIILNHTVVSSHPAFFVAMYDLRVIKQE
jgi:hypothetical protein